MFEFTYVMIKPDGVKKGLEEEIKSVLEQNGLFVVACKKENLFDQVEKIRSHYGHLLDKSFYPDLENFMRSGDVIPMIVLGDNAVLKVREIIGPTNVIKAREISPNSLRAKYGDPDFGPANVIHASDSRENAQIEIKRFFDLDIKQPKDYSNTGYAKLIGKHKGAR